MMDTKTLGAKGENLAAQYLVSQGCRIVTRNFRLKFGEIDLIVMDHGCLCFVEVKTRKGQHTPQEAVSVAKQRKLTRLAKMFMAQQFSRQDVQCRFDVIAIDTNMDGSLRTLWIRNAFDAVE